MKRTVLLLLCFALLTIGIAAVSAQDEETAVIPEAIQEVVPESVIETEPLPEEVPTNEEAPVVEEIADIPEAVPQEIPAWNGIDETQVTILQNIYSEMTEVGKTLSGWFVDQNPCDWNGITCENGYVTGLEFRDAAFFCLFPKSITELNTLKTLRMTDTMVSGPLPEELFKMEKLETLELSGNAFTGELPLTEGNMTLRELTISDNLSDERKTQLLQQWEYSGAECPLLTPEDFPEIDLVPGLDGEIPAILPQFYALTKLDLSGNALSGTVSSDLSALPLTAIDLSGNAGLSISAEDAETFKAAVQESNFEGLTILSSGEEDLPEEEIPTEESIPEQSIPEEFDAPVDEPVIPDIPAQEEIVPVIPEVPAQEEIAPVVPETPSQEEIVPVNPEVPSQEEIVPVIPEIPAREEKAPSFPDAPQKGEESSVMPTATPTIPIVYELPTAKPEKPEKKPSTKHHEPEPIIIVVTATPEPEKPKWYTATPEPRHQQHRPETYPQQQQYAPQPYYPQQQQQYAPQPQYPQQQQQYAPQPQYPQQQQQYAPQPYYPQQATATIVPTKSVSELFAFTYVSEEITSESIPMTWRDLGMNQYMLFYLDSNNKVYPAYAIPWTDSANLCNGSTCTAFVQNTPEELLQGGSFSILMQGKDRNGQIYQSDPVQFQTEANGSAGQSETTSDEENGSSLLLSFLQWLFGPIIRLFRGY